MENNKDNKKQFEDCTEYRYHWTHLFVPPFAIFNTLCISEDKTYLFLISFLRCIIIWLIIKIYYDHIELIDYWYNGFVAFFIYGIINLIIIVGVMLKQQKYRKQMDSEAKEVK